MLDGEIALLFLGALIGWAVSLYGFRVSEMANLLTDHINDLVKYSEELRLHWSKSFVDDHESQSQEIIRIVALYDSIRSFYSHHALYILSRKTLEKYTALNKDLLRTTTGAEFERIGRDQNRAITVKTMQISWELIQILRSERQRQYQIIAPFRILIYGATRRGRAK